MLKKPPPSRQIKQVSSSPPTGQTASLLERIKSLNRYSDHQKPLTHVASFTTDRVKNRARSNFSEYFDTNKLFNNTLEPVRSNSSKKKHFYDEKIESDDKLWSLKIKGQEQKQELAVLNEQNQKLQRNLEQVQHQLGHTDGNDDVEILKKILAGYKKKAEERKSIMKQLYGILKTKDQELEFLRNNYEKQIKSTEQKMINLKQESEAQLINAEERVAYIENKLLSISAFRQQKLHDLLCKEDKMREILQRLIRKQESKEKIDEVKTILNFIAKEKSKFESPQKSNVHQSKQIDAIQNEYQKIAQNYEQMTIQIDKMNKTFSKYLPKEYPYSDSITILQVNVKEIIHKVEDYDRQVKELQLDIESQQTEFSRLQKQRDQYKKKDQDIIKLTQQVSDLQVQLSTLENQYNQCLLQQRLDDESNSELSALNDQLNIQVVKQQSQIQLLSQQIDEQQKLIFSNEQILQSQYNKELEMNEELKELKQQFQSKEHEQKNKILLMQLNNQKESLAEQIESLQEELENKRLKISEQEQVNKQLNQKINKLLTDFKSQQDDLKNKKIIFEDFKRLQEQNQQATVLLEEAESRIEDLSQIPPKIVESILNIIQSTFHKQKQVQKQKSKISQNFISDLNIKEFSKLQQELDIIDQQIQQSESKINQLEISKSDLQNKNLEYYKQIEALMKQLEYFESNSNEFEQLQQNQIQLETSNKSLKTKNDELQHSINQMHQQQKLSYQQSQDITIQHQQEKNLLIQERKNLQNRIIDLESQIELDKQELEEKESEISQLMNNSTIDQYQQNLIQQQAQCKELLMLIQQQDEKISEDHQTIRNLQQQIQQQNAQLSNELQQKNYQINLLEGQLKQQIQEIANLELLIQHNENQRKEDDSNLKDIMSQSEKLMDEQKSNSGFLVDENNSLKEQLSQSTVQIIEIQQQIKVITTQHQQEMNKLLNKQNESGGEGFQSLNAQNTELLKQLEIKENERQIQQKQLIELKLELTHQQEINQELQSSIESSTITHNYNLNQIQELKQQISLLEEQESDIRQENDIAKRDLEDYDKKIKKLNENNQDIQQQLMEQKQSSAFLFDENNSLKKQLSQSKEQINDLQHQIEDITAQHQQEIQNEGDAFQSLNAQNTELLKQLEFKENERQIQQNQLIELKHELTHQQEINQELQSSTESSTSLKEQLSQSKEQINHLQHYIEDITAQHSQEIHNEGDAFQSLKAQNTELLKQLEIKENERQIQQNQLRELQQELTHQQEINQELQSSIESSTITHNYNLNQIQELKQQISLLEEQESDIRQENDIAKRDLEDYDKKIKKLNENNQDIQQQLMEQKQSSAFLFDENNSLKEQLSQSKEQINDLQHQIEDITAQHQQEIQNEGDAFQSLNAQNTELLKQLEIKENERQIQQKQLIELKLELTHQQEINQELQSSIESSTITHNYNLNQIQELKQQISLLEEQESDIRQENDIAKRDLEDYDKKIKKLNENNQDIQQQLMEQKQSSAFLFDENNSLKEQLSKSKEQNNDLQHQIEDITAQHQQEIQNEGDAFQSLKAQNTELLKQYEIKENERQIQQNQFIELTQELTHQQEINQELQSSIESSTSLKEQLSQSKEQINHLQHQIEDITAQHSQEIHNEGDAFQSLKAQNTELLKQLEIKENERQIQQNQLRELQQELTHQQEINQELQSSIESSTITNNYNLNQIQELKQQISQLEEQESDIRQENDIAKRDLEDYDKKIKKLNETNQDIQQQLMEQKQSSAFLFDENNSLKEQLSKSKEQINDLQHQIEDITAQHQQEIHNEGDAFQSLNAQNTELLKQLEIKENERQIYQNQFIELKHELTNQQEINQELQSSIESSTSLKEQLSQSKEQINHLQHQIEDITAQHSQEIHNEGDAFQSLKAQNTELLKQLEIKENERQIQQNQLRELQQELTHQQEINQELQSSIESSTITNNYNLNQIQELKQQISQLEEQESDIRQENDIAKRDLEDYDKKIKKLNENNQDIQQQLMEQKSSSAFLFDENNSLKEQLSKSKEQINDLQHQIVDIIAQHQQEIQNEGDAFQSLKAQNTELLKQYEIKENERQIQQNQFIELTQELTHQQEINQELQSSIEGSTITDNYNLNQIQELKQQISQLEEQESDIRQENDIAKRDLEDYDKKIKKLNENNQDIQQQLMEQKSSSAFLFDENNSLKEQLSQSKEQINDLQHQIEDITVQHQQEIQNEGDAFQSLKAQNTELLKQLEIKENERQIQQNQFIELTQELTHQQEINQELQSSIEGSTITDNYNLNQIQELKQQISQLEEQESDIRQENDIAKRDLEDYDKKIKKLNENNQDIQQQLMEQKSSSAFLFDENNSLKEQLSQSKEQINDLQHQIEDITVQHQQEIQNEGNAFQSLKAQNTELLKQLEIKENERQIQQNQLRELQQELTHQQEINQELQSSIESSTITNNYNLNQIQELKIQINQLKIDQTTDYQQLIQKLKEQNQELQNNYEELSNQTTLYFEQIENEKQSQTQLLQENNELMQSANALTEINHQQQKQINDLQYEIDQLQETILNQETEITVIREQNQKLQLRSNQLQQSQQSDTQILQQSDTLLIQQQDEQAIIYQQSQDFVQSPPQLNEQNDISLGNPLDSRSSSSSIKSLKKQKQVASQLFQFYRNSTENKVYGSNTILPAISQNASMNIDLKKSSQQSKDKHIMQLQEKVNQLFEENEKLKNDQLQGFCQFDDSPVKTTKQYEDLQKEIQQLKLEKEQIILQHIQDQNLADLINESPLKIPKDDREIIQDLKDKVIGLELEAQLVEFEKEGYLKDNLALRQEIQSFRLQVEYLTKSIKIQKETNIVLHNQKEGVFEQYIPPIHKCKGDNMINILERALNNDIEWSMYTSFTGLEDQQLERFKLLCNQLYQIAQLKGEAESLKKQLDQELFSKQRLAGEIKALVQEKKVLSQQCIDMQNEFDATSHRIKMSEPNSALKIDRSMDIDEGSANVRQLVGRQKRELESYKQENMMLKNIVRSHEEDEQRFCDQNKIVKDENKSLCAEIVQLKEDRNKLIEKLSNNQDGALTEHVISVLDKFFNAYLQENKQELKVYYQSLMSLIGKPQQEELILKLLSSIEKKKPSGLFKYF